MKPWRALVLYKDQYEFMEIARQPGNCIWGGVDMYIGDKYGRNLVIFHATSEIKDFLKLKFDIIEDK